MSKRKDAKLVYAQSSDIKARSYIEYRKRYEKEGHSGVGDKRVA